MLILQRKTLGIPRIPKHQQVSSCHEIFGELYTDHTLTNKNNFLPSSLIETGIYDFHGWLQPISTHLIRVIRYRYQKWWLTLSGLCYWKDYLKAKLGYHLFSRWTDEKSRHYNKHRDFCESLLRKDFRKTKTRK